MGALSAVLGAVTVGDAVPATSPDADDPRFPAKNTPAVRRGCCCVTGGSEATATTIRPTNRYMIAKKGARSPDRIAAPLAATVGRAR